VASPTAQPEGKIIYTVQGGDSLSLVAKRFNLKLSELYRYNDLTDTSVLQVGQELLLGYSVLPDGSVPLEGFPAARVRPDGTIIHTVAAGDSFYAIAATYDMTLEQFFEMSELDESSVLQLGQEVTVGFQPLPEEIGGSTDLPVEIASPTMTPTVTPEPTETAAVSSPTSVIQITEAQATAPTPPSSSASEAPDNRWLPIVIVIAGVLALAGGVLHFLRR
jgi:LysM repeat protein